MRILFTDDHALGDTIENLIALRHFHFSNPDVQINYYCPFPALTCTIDWLDRSVTASNADKVVRITMDAIHKSNSQSYHVIDCIEEDLRKNTGLPCERINNWVNFCLSDEEREAVDLHGKHGIPLEGYWLIDAGYKDDFATKYWGLANFQRVVNATRTKIKWVQIGALVPGHHHDALKNVIDMRGKTDNLRSLAKLMYRAAGVVTPVSAPMHMATMEWHNHADGKTPGKPREHRPCVVIHGARESVSFTQYPGHLHFQTLGQTPCSVCGGCWKNTVTPGAKGEKDCLMPARVGSETVPACMAMIDPSAVARAVLNFAAVEAARKKEAGR